MYEKFEKIKCNSYQDILLLIINLFQMENWNMKSQKIYSKWRTEIWNHKNNK